MCPLAECEEIEQLCHIVAPVWCSASVLDRKLAIVDVPHVGVVTLFPKACSYGGALLLHHRPLICDCLCGANIADKLLDCGPRIRLCCFNRVVNSLRELMLRATRTSEITTRTSQMRLSRGSLRGHMSFCNRGWQAGCERKECSSVILWSRTELSGCSAYLDAS